mmetsp:Transcript_32799/g.104591  ORF Transcript_32799/g.104591 Transcript_32799/m.104591 type:complete len:321 (-) Transcript_32799:538-1500(-)
MAPCSLSPSPPGKKQNKQTKCCAGFSLLRENRIISIASSWRRRGAGGRRRRPIPEDAGSEGHLEEVAFAREDGEGVLGAAASQEGEVASLEFVALNKVDLLAGRGGVPEEAAGLASGQEGPFAEVGVEAELAPEFFRRRELRRHWQGHGSPRDDDVPRGVRVDDGQERFHGSVPGDLVGLGVVDVANVGPVSLVSRSKEVAAILREQAMDGDQRRDPELVRVGHRREDHVPEDPEAFDDVVVALVLHGDGHAARKARSEGRVQVRQPQARRRRTLAPGRRVERHHRHHVTTLRLQIVVVVRRTRHDERPVFSDVGTYLSE